MLQFNHVSLPAQIGYAFDLLKEPSIDQMVYGRRYDKVLHYRKYLKVYTQPVVRIIYGEREEFQPTDILTYFSDGDGEDSVLYCYPFAIKEFTEIAGFGANYDHFNRRLDDVLTQRKPLKRMAYSYVQYVVRQVGYGLTEEEK